MTDRILGQKVGAAAKLKTSIAGLQPGSYVRTELERRFLVLTVQIDAELQHRAEESKVLEMIERLSATNPFARE